ncbi:hypothetical protein [Nonomuraea candida]|uniref:hypothetical protein n=1 Tax=Nonomuraea candida TaxID=359159 RepID=UPI0005BDA43A|nr:hypothetical protein [Nonomuraea candida]
MDDSLNSTAKATTEMDQVAEVATESPQAGSDADKWKSLSRTNEARWKAVSAELEAATAKNAELEQAIADMQAEHMHQLAVIQLEHAAKNHGLELGPEAIGRLDVSSFLDAAGQVDSAAIADFVNSFTPAQRQPKFPQNVGVGPQGSQPPAGPKSVPLDARARR